MPNNKSDTIKNPIRKLFSKEIKKAYIKSDKKPPFLLAHTNVWALLYTTRGLRNILYNKGTNLSNFEAHCERKERDCSKSSSIISNVVICLREILQKNISLTLEK